MVRIKIHNPCNEHTRYYRYYNYFWDKFTDYLREFFEVEENRYYEFAHMQRFEVNLKKGLSNEFLLLECEYVIENLDNGEFVVLSVADDLSHATLNEAKNPLLKKVLISQFLPKKIHDHVFHNFYKLTIHSIGNGVLYPGLLSMFRVISVRRRSRSNVIESVAQHLD